MINLHWPPSPVACPSCSVVCLLISEPNLQGLSLLSVETPRSQGVGPLFYSEDDVTDYTALAFAFFKGTLKFIGCENPVSEISFLKMLQMRKLSSGEF